MLCVCVCVCVCARARARACVRVYVCVCACVRARSFACLNAMAAYSGEASLSVLFLLFEKHVLFFCVKHGGPRQSYSFVRLLEES